MYTPCFIGEDCEASYRWKQLGQTPTGPFHKKGITLARLMRLLQDDFLNICNKNNLRIVDPLKGYKNSLGGCLRVTEVIDNQIGMELWHDFPAHLQFDEQYNRFIDGMSKEMAEFKNLVCYDLRPILFIHKKTDLLSIADNSDLKNQYRILLSQLKYHRAGRRFLLVALGHNDQFREDWKMENLMTLQIHTPKLWGHDLPEESWRKVYSLCNQARLL